MSEKQKPFRFTMYLRQKRDHDLISLVQPIDQQDRSAFIRELMRDGLKWRKFVQDNGIDPLGSVKAPAAIPTTPTISDTPIKLRKKILDKSEIEDKFLNGDF